MDQFRVHQIKNSDDQYYTEFWRIYSASFPLYERREIEQQAVIFHKPGYLLTIFISDNVFIGFISSWITKEFIFIEHFAIAPEFRNQGQGNAVLNVFIESNSFPIILEIEPPVDKITRSRLRFYESLNFKINNHNHSQPAYHKKDEPVPMKILSYPAEINDINYQYFARFQKEIVMGQFS